MLKFCVLASSSSGNCALVATPHTRLLIDAGLSAKETYARLEAIGENPCDIDAILITHEHADHVSGLPALARKLAKDKKQAVPVFLTKLTAPMIDWNCAAGPPEVTEFQAGTRFRIGDIEVTSFTIPHDAVDPVGFTFVGEGAKVGIATDLGYIPDSIKVHLEDVDLLLLESNHDLDMLKVGPYPWSVKQRVMSRKGHLSNDVASQFLLDHLSARAQTVMLGHLSEHNNHPEIARLIAAQALQQRALLTELTVCEPGEPSPLYNL
ncbi:MAG: MBL fold metallo-hydrolase [Bryobacteraceae bacterium]|nr:MBL fold metallo-hydrolase [Bryobacteraceae bacterium]